MKRTLTVPDNLNQQIQTQFPDYRFPNYLKETIKFISDSFKVLESKTPWGEPQRQLAYLAYFHTLNTIRIMAVLKELKNVVPDFSCDKVMDFGSGLGASELAYQTVFEKSPQWIFVEENDAATRFHKKVRPDSTDSANWYSQMSDVSGRMDTIIASYSLNELTQIPQAFFKADTVIFVEPSTNQHTRRLMQLRQQLIENDYQILAPCTHHGQCPLLVHSKKDWCYDRIHFDSPDWFKELEEDLPMTNRTLTFSYLVASKKYSAKLPDHPARVIGDTLKEKGKTRQMLCRGERREFLSWLKKYGTAPEIPHGALISLQDDLEQKGEEIRGYRFTE